MIVYGKELDDKIREAIELISKVVGDTLGPKGKNCLLQVKGADPIITKDGVTVAKFLKSDDIVINSIFQIIKQSAQQTAIVAGDGTTTSTVLACSLFLEAFKMLQVGGSLPEILDGIKWAKGKILDNISQMSTPISSIDDIRQIANISSNGDQEICDLLIDALESIGKDGAITIQNGGSNNCSLEVYEGFRFDSGIVANKFINDERRSLMKYDDCFVLVTDYTLSNMKELLPILAQVERTGKPLIIIAENIEGQALAGMLYNAIGNGMKVAAIKAPRFGEEREEILQDLAISIGAKFISKLKGDLIANIKLNDLALIHSIESNKHETTIVANNSQQNLDLVSEKISILKEQLTNCKNEQECEKLQERITRLSAAIAIIRVGAATEIEMIEKKHRLEDALEAIKSSQSDGYLYGAGTSLMKAAYLLQKEKIPKEYEFGANIIINACFTPFARLCKNANYSFELYQEKILEKFEQNEMFGLNIRTKEFIDLQKEKIIDPAKVTKMAFINAVSVASTLLTTGNLISQD